MAQDTSDWRSLSRLVHSYNKTKLQATWPSEEKKKKVACQNGRAVVGKVPPARFPRK